MSSNFNTNINESRNFKRRNPENCDGYDGNKIIKRDVPQEVKFTPFNNAVQSNFDQNVTLPSHLPSANHAYQNHTLPRPPNFNPAFQNEQPGNTLPAMFSPPPNPFFSQPPHPLTAPPYLQPLGAANANPLSPQALPTYPSVPAPYPLHNPTETFAPSINVSVPPPNFVDKNTIQYWNDKWKQKASQIKSPNSSKISIRDYKETVATLSSQIKELEKLTTHLQIMCKSLNTEDWNARKAEIQKQKVVVQKTMDDLKLIPLPEIQDQLRRRWSKRRRLKRKREEYREMRKADKAVCQLEHSRIDAWLGKMQHQVERASREEDIKKQADFVLSEVFHKKAEAKRMLGLLTTLGKLRNARIHDRQSKGEFVSKEAAHTFNNIIENLKKRWIEQVNGYNLEEQGLRVMLEDAETERWNVELSLSRETQQLWLRVVFGEQRDSAWQPHSLQDLVPVRACWDQFITTEEDSLIGSAVPNGWILPTPPSNPTWATFL